MTDTPKPKQIPRGAVAMGLSLPRTDRIARMAERRSVAALWLAALAWLMGGCALAAWTVAVWP